MKSKIDVGRRHLIRMGTAIPMFGLISGCDAIIPQTRHFLFKILANVDGVQKDGTSVFEFQYRRSYAQGVGTTGYYSQRVWGECPFIALKDGRALFGLLTPPDLRTGFNAFETADALAHTAPEEIRKAGGVQLFDYAMNLEGEHEVGERTLPYIVYFEDPSDPLSAKELPSQGGRVGEQEVRFMGATLTLTDDAVTHKLSDRLLPSYDGKQTHIAYPSTTPLSEMPIAGLIRNKNFTQIGNPP